MSSVCFRVGLKHRGAIEKEHLFDHKEQATMIREMLKLEFGYKFDKLFVLGIFKIFSMLFNI